MTRDEAIARWREAELKETAALVVEDKTLQKLLAVWPMVPLALSGFPVFAPDGMGCWDALWEGVAVDGQAVAELAGLQQGPAQVAFLRAKGLRLIYPDGTIHGMAKMVLQKRIKDALTGPRQAGKP